MALQFVDYLTAVMTLLIVVDVVVSQLIFYTLGIDFSKLKGNQEAEERLKAFGSLFLGLAVPLLVLGIEMDTVWPLPSSYNFIYGDMVVYIGTLLLVAGLLMLKSPESIRLLYPMIAVLGLFVIVYGADIFYYNLGQNPLAAAGMMVAEGLGSVTTSAYLFTSRKLVGYAAIALFVIAIIVTAITNVESIFDHTVSFKSWLP